MSHVFLPRGTSIRLRKLWLFNAKFSKMPLFAAEVRRQLKQMRSDRRKKKRGWITEDKLKIWSSTFHIQYKELTSSKCTQRVSFVLVFLKKRPGTKKNTDEQTRALFLFFFAWGQIPERMRNQWIFKITQTLHLIRVLERHPPHFSLFQFDISTFDLPKTVESMSRTNPQPSHRILMCMWASSVWV